MIEVALDLSGRPFLAWNVDFERAKIGEMDTELFEEFFRALAFNAMVTLHITKRAGHNAHHVAEACFKATARALRMASEHDQRIGDAHIVPDFEGAGSDSNRPAIGERLCKAVDDPAGNSMPRQLRRHRQSNRACAHNENLQ